MSEAVTSTDLMPGSIAYVYLPFVASKDVSADTFAWSNDMATWTPGVYVTTWPGPNGTTVTGTAVRAFVTLAAGKIPWYIKIGDSPESPILKDGYLQVAAS